MSKAANFSFVADPPAYKPARHCCGLAKVTTLYFVLTSLVILQLVLIAICSVPQKEKSLLSGWLYANNRSWEILTYVTIVFSVWLLLAITSFAGLIRKNPYFHLPLLVLEASFFLLSSAGVSWFLYAIATKQIAGEPVLEESVHRGIFVFVLCICHAYYCFVIYSLFADVKARRDTDAFIARQKILDEVCEEMHWEEEEKYHGNTLALSSMYYQESICYSNGSIASRELNTYYLDSELTPYNPHQQPKRYVTYYDEEEDSY